MSISLLFDVVYIWTVVLCSPVILYRMCRKGKYKDTLAERFGNLRRFPELQNSIWLHGVSVGEVKAAQPLIAHLKKTFPDLEIVVSSTSSSGKMIASNLYPDCRVISFPLDLSWVVKRFLNHFSPRLIILMELELWPNFLLWARKKNIPVVLLNGRLSEKSFTRFHRYAHFFFGWMTRGIHRFAVQTETYKERFHRLGIPEDKVVVTGNMKFDRVCASLNPSALLELQKTIRTDGLQILIAGSTHAPEEEWIIECYGLLRPRFPSLRVILVPRHPERAEEIEKTIEKHRLKSIRKSGLTTPFIFPQDCLLIGDVMGELNSLYSIGTVAFVGGSLIPHGGQNFIEPAGHGIPVLCGPYMHNFPEVRYFIEEKALIQVKNPGELTNFLSALLENPGMCKSMGEKARKLIEKSKGSSLKNLELCVRALQAERH